MSRATVALARRLRGDPLSTMRCSSEAQRELYRRVSDAEVFWRCGNQGGKTHGGAALGVALARGLQSLDGRLIGEDGPPSPVALPRLAVPNLGLLVVKGYKQSLDSAVAAYLRALGDWPHHIRRGAQGTVVEIAVKYDGCRSDDPLTWSRIQIHVDDGKPPVGIRADWAHADEPPSEALWREVRFRGQANRPFVRYITATPLDRRDWDWLRRDFEGCHNKVKDGKLELLSTVFDNRALSEKHKEQLRVMAANDPLEKARLYGEYVDTTGLCPFRYDLLQRWSDRCWEPELHNLHGVELEVWHQPEEKDQYLVICDPSSGVNDDSHDPCELVVVSRRRRGVVARFNGYSTASGLGQLAGDVAQWYNRALVIPEMNAFGEAFMIGLGDYSNVYMSEHHDRYTTNRSSVGWRTTATSRGTIIASLQTALLEDSMEVPSRDMIDCLMAVQVDHLGRVAAAPGRHDESLITLGIAAHMLETLPAVKDRKPQAPYVPTAHLISRSLGLRPQRRRREDSLRENWR